MREDADAVSFGAYRLVPERRLLLRGDVPVPLGARAFDLLQVLVGRHETVVSKDELMRLVWGGRVVEENTLAVHLSVLRRALGDGEQGVRFIATVPGRGYKFVAPFETAAAMPDERSCDRSALGALPRMDGPLFGRAAALAKVIAAVESGSLVTLTGPGGIGKTRLALAAGELLTGRFADGVWWIDLSPICDDALVAGTMARVLGMQLGDPPPLPQLAAALKGKQLLLILDNCEHLAAGVAELAVALRGVPDVRLLATSLEPLHVDGEAIERLESLAVPPPDAVDPHEVSAAPAVQLFAARARATVKDFSLDAGNLAAVVEVCRRLEGVPLAIELAAARAALLGTEPLARRLDNRLLELSGGRRDTLPKHQTLRALLDWSYGLLSRTERVMLRRLAVFAGGSTLEAVEAVAADDAVPEWHVAEHVASLIDKSLVIVEHTAQGARYRMLETTRTYAAELLAKSGEAAVIAARHARYIIDLFEKAYADWQWTSDTAWLRHYGPEIDNVRTALAWTFADPQRGSDAAALAGSTALFWAMLDLYGEGRRHVDRAVALLDEDTPPAIAARLLRRAGLLRMNFDRTQALPLAERCAELCRQTGDKVEEAHALLQIGTIQGHLGRLEEGMTKLLAVYETLQRTDQLKSLAAVCLELGGLSRAMGRPDEARRWYMRANEYIRASGFFRLEAITLFNLAAVEFLVGASESSIELTRQVIARTRENNQRSLLTAALTHLTGLLLLRGSPEEARPIAAEAFGLLRDEGGHWFAAGLRNWALLGAMEGRFREAAQLLGYVAAGQARAGETLDPVEQQVDGELEARLRQALSAQEIAAGKDLGAGWTEQQVAAFADSHLIHPAGGSNPASR